MSQETVRCTVYKSKTDKNAYVFLAAGKTPEDLPQDIQDNLKPFEKFKDLRVADDISLIAVSQSELLTSLARQGFYVQHLGAQQ